MPKTLQKHVMSHLDGAEENGENSKVKLKSPEGENQLAVMDTELIIFFYGYIMLAGNNNFFSSFIIFRFCQKV